MAPGTEIRLPIKVTQYLSLDRTTLAGLYIIFVTSLLFCFIYE